MERSQDKREAAPWNALKTGKEFSRLLYTNPVCFLGTCSSSSVDPSPSASRASASDDDGDIQRNVMVLSWLTTTNNQGRFVFSINKRRFTTTRFRKEIMKRKNPKTSSTSSSQAFTFTLSVPVAGMEDLVRNVGATSGSFGSKFPVDHETLPDTASETKNTNALCTSGKAQEATMSAPLSKRQQKKMRVAKFIHGIPGLEPVPLGHGLSSHSLEALFAIQGTVAHLVCKVCHVLPPTQDVDYDKSDCNATSSTANHPSTDDQCASGQGDSQPAIDDDHLLVLAEVTEAYVRSDYWDSNKSLFRPAPGALPYLTFFGSQTFGHVIISDN